MRKPTVAVIGAGWAGCAAAVELARRGAAESESTAANLDSRPAGPHSRDERSEGCIGVSDPQNPRRRSWLEPNCEHGSEHYIHHPASTVAHRSAIDTPPREADAVITRRGNYVRAHLCAPYLSGWHQLLCRILSLTCLPPGRWPSSCRLAARTSNTAGRLCPSVCAQDGDRGTR